MPTTRRKPPPPVEEEEKKPQLPFWAWLLQLLFFRLLGTGIAVYEVRWGGGRIEVLGFAAYLFLIPDAAQGTGIFRFFDRE